MGYDIEYFNASDVMVGVMRDVRRDKDGCVLQAQKYMAQMHDIKKAVITGPGQFGADTETHVCRTTEWQKLNG